MKSRIKKILCPIDFSESSIKAMECAAKLTRALDCSLTLWNIYEMTILEELASTNPILSGSSNKQDELSEILQDWCEEIKEEYNIPCGYLLASGTYSIADVLAQYTDGDNFDLLIASTNGHDMIHQFFFGANSYRIIQEVKCPIMFIPNDIGFIELKSVVFATDSMLIDSTLPLEIVDAINASFVSNYKTSSQGKEVEYVRFEKLIPINKSNRVIHYEEIIQPNDVVSNQQKVIEKNADLVVVSAMNTTWFEELFLKILRKDTTEGAKVKVPILIFNRIQSHLKEEMA